MSLTRTNLTTWPSCSNGSSIGTSTIMWWTHTKGQSAANPRKRKKSTTLTLRNQMRYEYLARDLKGTHDLCRTPWASSLSTRSRYGLWDRGRFDKLLVATATDRYPLWQAENRRTRCDQPRTGQRCARLLETSSPYALRWNRKPFNPNSQKQLAKLLQDVGPLWKKAYKRRSRFHRKNVLKFLATQDDPVVKEVAEQVQTLRNANKLLSTYLNGNTVDCSSEDGRSKNRTKGSSPCWSRWSSASYIQYRVDCNGSPICKRPPLQTIPRKETCVRRSYLTMKTPCSCHVTMGRLSCVCLRGVQTMTLWQRNLSMVWTCTQRRLSVLIWNAHLQTRSLKGCYRNTKHYQTGNKTRTPEKRCPSGEPV